MYLTVYTLQAFLPSLSKSIALFLKKISFATRTLFSKEGDLEEGNESLLATDLFLTTLEKSEGSCKSAGGREPV